MFMTSKFSDGKKKDPKAGVRWPEFWSFSRFRDFAQCPNKYFGIHIRKIKGDESDNPHIKRGIAVHKALEDWMKGKLKQFPKAGAKFAGELKLLKKLGAEAEKDYAIDKSYGPRETTDFKNVWLRFKGDATVVQLDKKKVVTCVDYKTGKKYGSHKDQAEIGAICIFSHVKDVDCVDVEFWYMDTGETEEFTFPKAVLPALKKKWAGTAKVMLSARNFKLKPS